MIAVLFFTSLLCLVLAAGASRWPRLWLSLTLAGTACALLTALHILGNAETWVWRASFTLGGETPGFFLDGVAAVFLVLVSLVGASSAVYSREYWSDRHYPTSAARGRAWAAILLLGMVLVPSLANGLHFLLAWEVFAISAYFLVSLERNNKTARNAGWLYLAASHAGTLSLFAFFAALAAHLAEDGIAAYGGTDEVQRVRVVGRHDDQRFVARGRLHGGLHGIRHGDGLVERTIGIAVVVGVVDARAFHQQHEAVGIA